MAWQSKTEYEVAYWVGKGCRLGSDKYWQYLYHFGIPEVDLRGKVVVDVGSGPLGGICSLAAQRSICVAVDPMFPDFEAAGCLSLPPGCRRVDSRAEDLHQLQCIPGADYVFSCNALDHSPDPGCDNVDLALARMVGLLRSGGQLCLWVHLRRQDQLDYGHDVPLTAERIVNVLRPITSKCLNLNLTQTDPVNGSPFATLAGRWQA